jgi:hypothetical protein
VISLINYVQKTRDEDLRNELVDIGIFSRWDRHQATADPFIPSMGDNRWISRAEFLESLRVLARHIDNETIDEYLDDLEKRLG